MAVEVVNLNCKYCGAPVSAQDEICKYCNKPITIRTFNSVSQMPFPDVNRYANSFRTEVQEDPNNISANKGLAYCYLKLGLYDQALSCFEKAIVDNFDDSEVYFYAAVCLLHGKKAFVSQRPIIQKIEEYLQAATMIEPRGIYYYFWAYIKYDYFKRKFLNTSPTFEEYLNMANQYIVTPADVQDLFLILKVENPFN